jgi:hypothetical protein
LCQCDEHVAACHSHSPPKVYTCAHIAASKHMNIILRTRPPLAASSHCSDHRRASSLSYA